jgi:hypothetical protein
MKKQIGNVFKEMKHNHLENNQKIGIYSLVYKKIIIGFIG